MKFLLYTVLFVVFLGVSVTGVFVFYALYEEPLADGYEEFFETKVAPDSENGFIEMMGIVAPINQSPRYVAQKFIDEVRNKPRITEWGDLDKAMEHDIDFDKSHLNDLVEKTYHVTCWMNRHNPHIKVDNPEECLSETELDELIIQYEPYLERMYALNKYQAFDYPKDIDVATLPYGQTLISLHQLEIAHMGQQIEKGDYKTVIQNWLQWAELNQKTLAGHNNMVGQAINLVNYGMVNAYLSDILNTLPFEIIQKYEEPLKHMLDFQMLEAKGWNVQKTMQAENYMLIGALKSMFPESKISADGTDISWLVDYMYKDNETRNDFYEFAQDMVSLSRLPVTKSHTAQDKLAEKYDKLHDYSHLVVLAPNGIGKMLLPGVIKGSELILNAHRHQIVQDLLRIQLKAKLAGVPLSEMGEFVAENQQDNFYEEMTYKWNAEEQKIYADQYGFQDWIYVAE